MGKFHTATPLTKASTGIYTQLDDNPVVGFGACLEADDLDASPSWRDYLNSDDCLFDGIEAPSDIMRLLDIDSQSDIQRSAFLTSDPSQGKKRSLKGETTALKK